MSRHSQSSCLEELERLQQTLTAQQRQLNDLVAEQQRLLRIQQAQPKPLEMWKPEDEQRYYAVLSDNDIYCGDYTDPCDRKSWEMGNCFPTEELVTHYAARRAARQRLEMLALAQNGMVPYVPDEDEDVFCIIIINKDELCVYQTHAGVTGYFQQYFPTRKAAQRVLSAMTDSDLILLYGTANRGDK